MDNNTSKALPGGQNASPADSTNENVQSPNVEGKKPESGKTPEIKDVLSEALGKETPFADNETAIRAVKETFSYVGKAGKFNSLMKQLTTALKTDEAGVLKVMENIANEQPKPADNNAGAKQDSQPEVGQLSKTVGALQQQLADSEFFRKNPELEAHKGLLEKMRGNTGKSFDDILKDEDMKSTFDKVKAHDEQEKKKSVIHSNPRLGKATDRMTKARELVQTNQISANQEAVGAVMDAFDMVKE